MTDLEVQYASQYESLMQCARHSSSPTTGIEQVARFSIVEAAAGPTPGAASAVEATARTAKMAENCMVMLRGVVVVVRRRGRCKWDGVKADEVCCFCGKYEQLL
jgi:hypothetical protein